MLAFERTLKQHLVSYRIVSSHLGREISLPNRRVDVPIIPARRDSSLNASSEQRAAAAMSTHQSSLHDGYCKLVAAVAAALQPLPCGCCCFPWCHTVTERGSRVETRGVREQIFRTNSIPFQWLHSHSHPIPIWNLNPVPIFSHPAIPESLPFPLLKKPTLDKEELSNYRPISNLSRFQNNRTCRQIPSHGSRHF